jgi:hypothetical protein
MNGGKPYDEGRSNEEAVKYVNRCVTPSLQNSILKSLDQLNSDGIETELHTVQSPFRVFPEKRNVSQPYVYINDTTPMNHFGGLDSFVGGPGFFEVVMSAAISGNLKSETFSIPSVPNEKPSIYVQKLGSAGRVVAAIAACMNVQSPEALSIILDSDKYSDDDALVQLDNVKGITDELFLILKEPGSNYWGMSFNPKATEDGRKDLSINSDSGRSRLSGSVKGQ